MRGAPLTERAILQDIAALKTALTHAPHDPQTQQGGFDQVAHQFLDLARSPLFHEMSEATHGEDVVSLLLIVARRATHRNNVELRERKLLRVPQAGFVHGGGWCEGGMMMAFYFEDARLGLAMWSRPGGQTLLARLTAMPVSPGEIPPLANGEIGQA